MVRTLHRVQRITVKRLSLHTEAAFFLLLARLAIKILPFKYLIWYFKSPIKEVEVFGPEREHLRMEVSRAIDRTAAFLPGKTVCFPRGIAAQSMLRRRGVGTTLYYGAATLPDQGLTSHVWVQDGVNGVVGHNESNDFIILARYPEMR